MAAAYSNSLQALNGIYGALDSIVKILATSDGPQAKQEKAKNDIKTLNKGGLSGVQEAEKGSGSPAVITSASLKDMASALLSLPPAIRVVAGIGPRQINNVVTVLEKLNSAFANLAVSNEALKGTVALKNLAESLIKLQDLKFFSIILTFTALDKAKIGDKMGRVFKGIMTSYKAIGEVTKEDMEAFNLFVDGTVKMTATVKRFALMTPLMPLFILSTAMFSPGLRILAKAISKMPDKDKVQGAVMAANILNTFVKSAGLIIISAVALTIAMNKIGKKEMLTSLGVVIGVIGTLGLITIAVSRTAGRSNASVEGLKQVNKFINSLAFTTGLIFGLSAAYTMGAALIKPGLLAVSLTIISLAGLAVLIGAAAKLMHMRRSLKRVTRFITSMVLLTGVVMGLSVFANAAKDQITGGLGIVAGIILGLTLITLLVGTLSMVVNKRGMFAVLAIAAFSLALVLGTALIGALVMMPGVSTMLLVGLGTVTGVILAYSLIAMLAGILGTVTEALAPSFMQVLTFAAFSLALVMGTILIGALVVQGWPLLIAGLGGVLGVVMGFEGILYLTQKVSKTTEGFLMAGGWKQLLLFAGGAVLLTGAVVLLGYAIHKVGIPWVLAALVATGLVLVGLRAIAVEATKLGESKTLPKGIAALKELGIFAAEVMAITGGIVLIAKLMETIDNKWMIAATFGLMSAIMWEAVVLAKYINKHKITFNKGVKDMASLVLFMGAAELLAFGLVGLAKALEATPTPKLFGAIALVTGIVLSAVGLATLATKYKKKIDKGAKDLLQAMAIMGAAEVLAGGVILLANALETTSTGKIFGAIGLMTGLIVEAAALAAVATKFKKKIDKGAKSILIAVGLMAAAEVVAGGVILLAKKLESVSAGNIFAALGLMTAIIVEAGALALVASKLKRNIKKGAVAILVCEGLALAGVLVLSAVVSVAKKGEGYWDESLYAIGEMTLMIGAIGALAFAAGALLMGPQAILFGAGAAALAACEGLAFGGAKMLESVINVTKQSEGVDFEKIKSTFGMMREVIKLEVGLMKEASKSLKALLIGAPGLKRINKVIDSTCETISKFIMLSTFMEKAGIDPTSLPEQLKEILTAISPDIFTNLFNDGFIKTAIKIQAGYKSYSKVIDIVKKAFDIYGKFIETTKAKKINPEELAPIAGAIAEGLESFMSKLSNNTVTIKEKYANRMGAVLQALVEPVSSFAEMLTKFDQGAEDGKIAIISYDEKGNAKVGHYVDVGKVATTIAGAVTTFCDILFSKERMDMWKELGKGPKEGESPLQAGIGVFASVVEPVVKFAKVLETFEAESDGETILIPQYDEKGNLIENKRINVVNVARVLAGAVTTFINELYVKQKDSWTAILSSLNSIDPTFSQSEEDKEKVGNKAGLTDAIGIFGEILNPVLSFASVLLKFGTDKENQLVVLDEEGKPHPVDVAVIASGIAGAVTTFIREIAGIFTPEIMESISSMNESSVQVLNVLNGFIENVSNAASIDMKNLILATGVIPGFVGAFAASIKSLNTTVTEDEINVFEGSFTKLNTALNTFLTDTYSTDKLAEFAKSTLGLQENVNILLHKILIAEDVAAFETTVNDFIAFLGSSYTSLFETITPEDTRYTQFLETNKTLSEGIKDSLSTLFSTLSVGAELEEFVTNSTTYKTQISDMISNFLTDIVKKETLEAFQNDILSFKEVVKSSFDKVFGSISMSILVDKVIMFSAGVKAVVQGMFKTMISPEDITGFTSSMDLISSSVQNVLGESIPDDSLNRFERIMNTIKSSTEILANEKTITDTDKFNKNLETLMNNLSSASETSKVKRITTLGNAVKSTTGEMTKFDTTLKNGNATRIKELNDFGKAVGNISAKIKNAKDGLSELKSVISAIERVDGNKISSLTEAISTAETRAASAASGGGGVSINYKVMAEEIAKAIGKIFDNASLEPSTSKIVYPDGDTRKTPSAVARYTFDVQGEFTD